MYAISKLILLIIAIILLPSASADISQIHISPKNPVVGDIITISGIASPDELIDLAVSYTTTLTTSNGRFLCRVGAVEIPPLPNSFQVTAGGVEKTISVSIKRWNSSFAAADSFEKLNHNEIIQVMNDPDHMEQGFIRFDVKGGRR